MKSWSHLLVTTLLLVVTCHGQSINYKETVIHEPSVPRVVLNVFRAEHPAAKTRGYAMVETEGAVFYKIEAREDGALRYFSYTPQAELNKTDEVIAASDLPANAQQSIQEKYPDAVVSFAQKTIKGDRISYRANAKNGNKIFSFSFDAAGKVISAGELKVVTSIIRAPE